MICEESLAALLEKVKEIATYEEICKLSSEQLIEYQRRLERLKTVNGGVYSTVEKGDALESLVAYLLKISGGIFKVEKNVRTSSNEIDEIIELNSKGNILLNAGIIPERYASFLGECKNYEKKVNVTYVGKFYSLLQTTGNKTGILFSYYGVSGSGWSNASGLIKKIYLQREDITRRVAIIDFSICDFEKISKGQNFLEIIDGKLKALRYDTSVEQFLSKHPAENMFS